MPSYVGEVVVTPWGERRMILEIEDAGDYICRKAAEASLMRVGNFDREYQNGRTVLVDRDRTHHYPQNGTGSPRRSDRVYC